MLAGKANSRIHDLLSDNCVLPSLFSLSWASDPAVPAISPAGDRGKGEREGFGQPSSRLAAPGDAADLHQVSVGGVSVWLGL